MSLGEYISMIPNEVNIIYINLKDTYGEFLNSLKRCINNKNYLCFFARIIISLKKFFGLNAYRIFKYILPVKSYYDIMISFRHGFCAEVGAYAIKSKKKIVWWHHGQIELTKNEKKNLSQTFSKYDSLVAVSNPICHMLKKTFPKLKRKICTIPNMIDCKSIEDKSCLYCPYETSKKKKIIVSVGRIAPEKHFENVVYATKKLIEKNFDNFEWYIVGGDWDFEKIKEMVISNNLEKYIKMVGKISNPYPYIKNADIFVHTSYVESQGLAILEAMALGCPSVVTESVGAKSFVIDEVNAILVKQNVDSLVNGILKLYNNELIKRKIVNGAYETVKKYLPEVIMSKFYLLLDKDK